jgi:hypothetical protein
MAKNEAFRGGVKSSRNNIQFSVTDMGDHYNAMAMDDDGNVSSGDFDYDTTTGNHEVIDGTLSIHPSHQGLGVGQQMRKLVNIRAARPNR